MIKRSTHARFAIGLALALVLAAAAGPPLEAGLFSERFDFQPGVRLAVGVATEAGLRLDYIVFKMPALEGDHRSATAGVATVQVAISNTADRGRRVGIAIALHDAEGRLVGAANGGSQLTSIKAGRQKIFILSFAGVNGEAHRATTFHISLEDRD